MTSQEKEIIVIEHTLRDIFSRDVIRRIDVNYANKLFGKWMVLTGYVSDDEILERPSVLDKEPEWVKQKIKQQNYENNQR